MLDHESSPLSWGRPSYVWRFGQERRLALAQQFVSLQGKRVLDIGCGIGTYLSKLARFGGQVHGVDIDLAKVVEARRVAPLTSVAAAEALPYPPGYFDVVMLHEVIEHVSDDRLAVEEALRCTRPEGHVVIFAPNRLYPFETHGISLGDRYREGNFPLVGYLPAALRDRLCPHARAYTSSGLRRLLKGLDAQVLVHSQIFAGYDKLARRYPRLGNLLRRVSYALEKTPLRAFGLSHFMVVRKGS